MLGFADHEVAALVLEVDALVDDGEWDVLPARVLVREVGDEHHALLGDDRHEVRIRQSGALHQLVGPGAGTEGHDARFHVFLHAIGILQPNARGSPGGVKADRQHFGLELEHGLLREVVEGPLEVAHGGLGGVEAAAVLAKHTAHDGLEAQVLADIGIHVINPALHARDARLDLFGVQQFEVHPVGGPDLGSLGDLLPGLGVVGEEVAALLEPDGHARVVLEVLEDPDGLRAELLVDGSGPEVPEASRGESRGPRGHGIAPVHHQDGAREPLLAQVEDQRPSANACAHHDQIERPQDALHAEPYKSECFRSPPSVTDRTGPQI